MQWGLLAGRRQPRMSKIGKLMEIAAKSHAVADQEVHGTAGDADTFLHNHRAVLPFFSPCAVRGAGGVLFLVGVGNFGPDATCELRVVVPGRAARRAVRSAVGTHVFGNVHKFDIKSVKKFKAKD